MTESSLRPVPGYGGALDDFNRIPVLTVADRVRRDIVLPVLGCGGKSRFAGSANGSSLIYRQPVKLSLLEEKTTGHTVGYSRISWKPAQRGWWYSIHFYHRSDDSVYLMLYNQADNEVFRLNYGDPILWLPMIQGQIWMRAQGEHLKYGSVKFKQFG